MSENEKEGTCPECGSPHDYPMGGELMPCPECGHEWNPTDLQKEAATEYPLTFPIKVMGAKRDGFVHAVTETARRFDPTFDAATIELRESRRGNYLSVTITVWATSRAQLDALYQALTSHPLVKVVL